MREKLTSLADRMAGPDKVVAKAASAELERTVHRACAPGTPGATRAAVRNELVEVLRGTQRPRMVRAQAARLLGYVGSKADDRALGAFARDPELKDDIAMARERLRRSG